MLIGELEKQTHFSKDTIRFYEKQGLITVSKKDRRQNNYKEYSNEILQRLLAIKRLKQLGLTLREISPLLHMIEANEANCNHVCNQLAGKVGQLNQKIIELGRIKSSLLSELEKCEGYYDPHKGENNCPIVGSLFSQKP